MPSPGSTAVIPEKKSGLLYWAQRVLEECDNASRDFAADPVHDLRVAIRRCRSMADGFLSVDPDPGWKQMKRMAKPLFASLGDLRDVQVMMEWVDKLSSADDPARAILLLQLQVRETELKAAAQQELGKFDRKHWLSLNTRLSARAEQIPPGGSVFQLLALERWNEARELHRKALRNRSGAAYHQLRIGFKRLRYTVENFLPALHEKWSKDLRDLQDALGEVHDFDVLWALLRMHPEIAADVRRQWRATIEGERSQRLAMYRQRMVGRQSLWSTWRAELPAGEALERARMDKLRLWASLLDPHFEHATRVSSLALRLYDALAEQNIIRADPKQRSLLEAAALMHEIGRSKQDAGHRKRGFRMVQKVAPSPGWSAEDMTAVAIIARYHRGTIAPASHRMFQGMPAGMRKQLLRLAGILRLATALEITGQEQDVQLAVSSRDGVVVVAVPALDLHVGPAGERLAQARYLLEATCGVAIKFESVASPKRTASAPQRMRRASSAEGSTRGR
jgi:CHAD domain-containing protein